MSAKFCHKCGTKLSEGAKFCSECGEKILPPNNNLSASMKSVSASNEDKLNKAIEMYKHNKFEEAFPIFKKYAENGNIKAMVYLAESYDSNCNDTAYADDKKAFYWYKKAADLGDADAQYYVGYCYVSGIGVPVDEDIAYTWIKKAAKNGSVQAQRELKYLYGE